MLCALRGDAWWVLAIDCTSKNGIKHTLEIPFVRRNPSFQVEHLTLCAVWPGRIPSSSFQAQEKEEWSSHIGQGSLPISFSQPQSNKGGNGYRGLKNTGNWAHVVFYCMSKPIEASRRQPSNDAGISDTALIHSMYMEGRWQWTLTLALCSWTRSVEVIALSPSCKLPVSQWDQPGVQCGHGLTWFHGEFIFLKLSSNKYIRERNVSSSYWKCSLKRMEQITLQGAQLRMKVGSRGWADVRKKAFRIFISLQQDFKNKNSLLLRFIHRIYFL